MTIVTFKSGPAVCIGCKKEVYQNISGNGVSFHEPPKVLGTGPDGTPLLMLVAHRCGSVTPAAPGKSA